MAFCGRGRRAPRLRGHIRRPAGGETKRMCVRRCTRLPRTGTRPLPPVPVPVLVPVSSVAAPCLVLEGSTRDRELRGSQHSAVRALGRRVHAHTKWRDESTPRVLSVGMGLRFPFAVSVLAAVTDTVQGTHAILGSYTSHTRHCAIIPYKTEARSLAHASLKSVGRLRIRGGPPAMIFEAIWLMGVSGPPYMDGVCDVMPPICVAPFWTMSACTILPPRPSSSA